MQWLVLSRVSLQGLRVELSQLTCPNEPASHFPRLSSFLAESGQARNTCSRPPGGSTATYCSIRVAQAPGRCKPSSRAKAFVWNAEKKTPLPSPINSRDLPVETLSFLWKALSQVAMNLEKEGQIGEATETDFETDFESTPDPSPPAFAKPGSLVPFFPCSLPGSPASGLCSLGWLVPCRSSASVSTPDP
jgi:hypothetical protein